MVVHKVTELVWYFEFFGMKYFVDGIRDIRFYTYFPDSRTAKDFSIKLDSKLFVQY